MLKLLVLPVYLLTNRVHYTAVSDPRLMIITLHGWIYCYTKCETTRYKQAYIVPKETCARKRNYFGFIQSVDLDSCSPIYKRFLKLMLYSYILKIGKAERCLFNIFSDLLGSWIVCCFLFESSDPLMWYRNVSCVANVILLIRSFNKTEASIFFKLALLLTAFLLPKSISFATLFTR